jgi:S-adenosylmethionine:tRNA ribosyltransferase-isomerase
MTDLFDLNAYHYELPRELIAQQPSEKRDQSRLLLVDRQAGNFSEIKFCELTDFLKTGDSLIFNETKVIPARLFGKRSSGGVCEIFLSKRLSLETWEVLARPGKKLKIDSEIIFGERLSCQVLETTELGTKIVRFQWDGIFEELLSLYGRMPLPHYIKRDVESTNQYDLERYQTVYAKHPGAVAAPTAGLHFSKNMLETLNDKAVQQHYLTLHVGLGTFKPVEYRDIRHHAMHAESYFIDQKTAEQLNARSNDHKQICVGTTCCRALESACNNKGQIQPGSRETNIFIYPGYQFKYVKSLLTNFHLPGSTLLMLVSAFAGYELIKEAYAKAVKERFRFFSYGDAMLIV